MPVPSLAKFLKLHLKITIYIYINHSGNFIVCYLFDI